MLKFTKKEEAKVKKIKTKFNETGCIQKSRVTESDLETAAKRCGDILEYFNKYGKLPVSS